MLYRWIEGFEMEGVAGLEDQMRRPRWHPNQTSEEVEAAIAEFRRKHPDWGPKRIVHVLSGRDEKTSWPARSTVAREAIRSDNGVPFASTGLGRLSRLLVWWIKLGIRPELTQPARPEQNGSHERMHRTLKRATTRPADLYRPSPRAFPSVVPRMEYPGHFEVRRVGRNGGIWNLHCGPLLLGRFDEREETLYAAFYAQRPWYRGGRAGRAAEGSTQEDFRDLHSATTTR
jgi:transposase InsO family protein